MFWHALSLKLAVPSFLAQIYFYKLQKENLFLTPQSQSQDSIVIKMNRLIAGRSVVQISAGARDCLFS